MARSSKKTPSAKAKVGVNADVFKRRKAKVGKRAPKAANETDTSFKKASLQLRNQVVADESIQVEDSILISTRGRSIHELAVQLQHFASNVRISASKGLYDATKTAGVEVIQRNLSVLLPTLGKCCIDENEDVRETGLKALKEIITKLTFNNAGGEHLLKPFGPLLLAFVTSALNSLDRSIRRHGSTVIQLLAASTPTLIAPSVPTLIPPFVRLLSERSSSGNQQLTASAVNTDVTVPVGSMTKRKNRNKRKRKNNTQQESARTTVTGVASTSASADNPQVAVLEALASILQTLNPSIDKTLSVNKGPDLSFTIGGKSSNALLLLRQPYPPQHPMKMIKSLDHFPFLEGVANHENNNLLDDKESDKVLSSKTIYDLLSQLRNALVEAFQVKGRYHLKTLVPAIKILRLFWQGYTKEIMNSLPPKLSELYHEKREVSKEKNKTKKLVTQLANLILECFPLQSSDESVDELNSDLCMTLLNIASIHSVDEEKRIWLDTIATYVQETLEQYYNDDDVDKSSPPSAISLLQVLERILICLPNEIPLLENKQIRATLLETFCGVFFDSEKQWQSACLSANRYAVGISASLFEMCSFKLDKAADFLGLGMIQILRAIPFYLAQWKAEYPEDVSKAIILLENIVRLMDEEDTLAKSLLHDFRTGMEALVASREESGKAFPSFFEQFPAQLQHQVVSFIVLIEQPTEAVLHDLGAICARCRLNKVCCISDREASFMVQSIHTIRKTISMQKYFGFLIDCTGLVQLLDETATEACIPSLQSNLPFESIDRGLAVMSSCLVECGTSRVLGKLETVLLTFLKRSCMHDDSTSLTHYDAISARAALALLAVLSLDYSQGESIPDVSIFDFLSSNFQDVVNESIACVLFYGLVAPAETKVSGKMSDPWSRPIQALLHSEKNLMLLPCFELIYSKMEGQNTAGSTKELGHTLQVLFMIIKDQQLAEDLRRSSETIYSNAKEIYEKLKGGPLENLSERFLAQIELTFGYGE